MTIADDPSITHVACHGGTTGSIEVEVSGGTGAYSYSWTKDDVVTTSITGGSPSGLSAGIYTVKVTDAKGCTETLESVQINQPAAPLTIADDPSITHVACHGGTTGSIEVEVSGGTATYEYLWTKDDVVTTFITGGSPSGLSAGTYTVELTDAKGCSETLESIEITDPDELTHEESKTACESYTWNGNTYTSSGTYEYLTTNAMGCDSTVTLNLTINNSSTHRIYETACESYTWKGNKYTSSGTYKYVTTNAMGCDSTVTLVLSIEQKKSYWFDQDGDGYGDGGGAPNNDYKLRFFCPSDVEVGYVSNSNDDCPQNPAMMNTSHEDYDCDGNIKKELFEETSDGFYLVKKGMKTERNENQIVEWPYFQSGIVADKSYEGIDEPEFYPSFGRVNHSKKGYSDWYVPDIGLLKQIVDNLLVVTGNENRTYWSSTKTYDYIDNGYLGVVNGDLIFIECNPPRKHPQNKTFIQNNKQEGESVIQYINPCHPSTVPPKHNIIPVHKWLNGPKWEGYNLD